jgi:PAS domain S-box-containing protein
MNKRLRILHLEDEPDFTELVRSLLTQEKVEAEIKQVDDRKAFQETLENEQFDVIISDFHLPQFTGLEALKIARQKAEHTPFILVSGTIGEQAAIEGLKSGATDYVLKQNPDRLPQAILRAVTEAAEHLKLREAEEAIARSEKYFRTLTENSLDVLFIFDAAAKIIHLSPSVHRVLGYLPEELIGHGAYEIIHVEDQPEVMRTFHHALENPQETVKLQFRCRHKEGSWCHLEALGLNRVHDPAIGGLVVNCRDVTDRWRVEEELRGSEKQYRLLFQGNPNPMWVFDLETLAFLEVNEAAIHHYGYSRKEFLAMTISEIRQPTLGTTGRADPQDTADRGLVWRHRRKDGKVIDAEVIWSPIVFRGRFAALTMATDVTERRRVQHRNAVFSKLSHRLSSATTAAEAAMIICEAADELFKWDDFALDLYLAERDEVNSLLNITTVEGQRVELPPSPQPKTVNALVQRVITNGAELLTPAETKSHSAATMLAPIRKGERVIGILFIQNRITGIYTRDDLETLQTLADQSGGALERLRAEQGLRESQQRFRDLFENSPDAILVENMEGVILDANAAASLLCGVPRDQLAGKNGVYDIVPKAGQEIAWQQHQKMVRGEISQTEGEILTTDGRTVPIEARAARIEYNGRPALLFHIRDITERHAAEAALRSSETLFRSVWENSADGMRLTDEEGVIIAVNGAFCKLVGMDQEDLEGKPLSVVYSGAEDIESMLERHRESFRNNTLQIKKERPYKLFDGREVIFEITDSFVELRGKPLLALSLFRDVSMQRRLEEQLRHSQKMEAIGQLAGGVAHDFNNILTVIHGHASLLLMGDLDDTCVRSAQQISQAAERAAGLTRQLLTFSRRQLIQPKRLDMNRIVGNMTDMLGRLLGEDVALQLNYCHNPAMVEADAGMMEQVLLNLAVNARDAMPRGGQLFVRIAVIELKEDHVQVHPEARVGKFVCVSKTDTGCGIPPENLSRIFEPFFTTKEVGKGTGLGLATVYGIVKQHQGWIEVSSEVGKGTTFRVYIPYVGEAPVEAEKPSKPVSVVGGTETILLVEDERPVRELVARVLQKHGYKILMASTGDEAVEVWNNRNCEIHLLLTDLIMPGNMNGRELAEKICAEHPGIKVVFTSGYSADIVGRDFKLEPEINFLQKPYHPHTLALTVRRCLDRKNGGNGQG